MPKPTRPIVARHRRAAATSLTVVLVAVGAPAVADPPSDDDRRSAQDGVTAAEGDVATIEAELAGLRVRGADAQVAVQSAAEDYASAQVALDQATAEVDAAQAGLDSAAAEEGAARSLLGAVYRAGQQSSGALDLLGAVVGAQGVDDLVGRDQALRVVGRQATGAVDRHASAKAVADSARARSAAALDRQHTLSQRASDALAAAQQASADLDAATSGAAARRDVLIARLATARATSVEVERERQDALDAQRAQEREDRARTARQGAAPVVPVAPTAPVAPVAPAAPVAPVPPPVAPSAPDPAPAPAPPPAPAPGPTPPPSAPPPSAPQTPPGGGSTGSSQGQAAVDWARSKIGSPYVFGGTGPGYDCSGLTSRAWATVGVDITRTSRSQYARVGKVGYDALRPGDLVFYGSNAQDPSSIYHVAIYAGGGQMIEASRPGVPVRITPMRWEQTMPYAGRP